MGGVICKGRGGVIIAQWYLNPGIKKIRGGGSDMIWKA